MIRAKMWDGSNLKGVWRFSIKLDGVRALWNDSLGIWESRGGKPLYNIPSCEHKDVEVYLGTFKETIQAVRTKNITDETPKIEYEHLYPLDPLDDRLLLFDHDVFDPTAAFIQENLEYVRDNNCEGLVLRKNDIWLKVKPEETYDVIVRGQQLGQGKYSNVLGYFETDMGRVGTGLTDEQRREYWNNPIVGKTIEVSCMQLTPDGKFRHASFVRERPDKDE